MSKHTPGPWKVINDSVWSVDAGICIVRFAGGNLVEESLENARLIASAPDLLEALRMAMCYVSNEGSEEEYQQARAAIAKATGEQQ